MGGDEEGVEKGAVSFTPFHASKMGEKTTYCVKVPIGPPLCPQKREKLGFFSSVVISFKPPRVFNLCVLKVKRISISNLLQG